MRHYDSLDAFAADLPELAQRHRDRLAGHTGAFRLETRQGRGLMVLMEDGAVTLRDSWEGDPDCVIAADERDLLGIVNGEINPATALLFGKVRIQGNPAKILALIRLL